MWYLSLEESLLHLEPSLESLTSKESRKRLFALTSHFPDSLSSSFGFESRLLSAAGDVDFALHVTADKREVLAGLDSKSAFARTFGENPAWQRVLQFSRRWADPSSELHYLVADIWLEFDLCGGVRSGGRDVPIPGLFFRPTGPGLHPDTSSRYDWLLERALPILMEEAPSYALRERFRSCMEKLPDAASIFQVGLLLGRDQRSVRLCLTGMEDELAAYLTSIGCDLAVPEIQAAMAKLSQYVDGIIVDIDVGETVFPRVGIEGVYHSLYRPCVDGRWRSLLDHLVEEGLCCPDFRDRLLDYVGLSLTKTLYHRIYIRALSHIKLQFDATHNVRAKAYFGATHWPLAGLSHRGKSAHVDARPAEAASDAHVKQRAADAIGAVGRASLRLASLEAHGKSYK
jgi:hypothetical protein